MANFSSKVLGLFGAAMLFAGMSYGQTLTFNPQTPQGEGIIIDRFEDTTALVGDGFFVVGASGNPTAVVNATVTVTLNEPVTSQTFSSGKYSEVLLNVGATASATGLNNGATLYAGVVSGSTITFTGVNIPADTNVAVQNVRVNASLAPSGTSSFAITETMTITTAGFLNYSNLGTPLQVGVVQTGFSVPKLSATNANGAPFLPANPAIYYICTGNPPSSAANPILSFSIAETQNFSGAFKVQASAGQVTLSDQGSNVNPAAITLNNGTVQNGAGANAAIGAATHGDRWQVVFSNVPSGVTIYLPLTIVGTALGGGGNLTLTLGTQGATGAQKLATATNPKPAGGAWAGPNVAPYTPSGNGTITAWYDVATSDNVTANLSFAVVGYVYAAAGFSTSPTPAITASLTPAPTTGSDIPTFANQNYPTLTLNAFAACATDLLFPFVSSAGFDTGIAISNTGTDPLGSAGAGTGAPGGCTLNFYGSVSGGGTVPGPTAAPFLQGPQLGVLPSPAAPNYTGTFLLSSVVPNFTGYIIAQCNFLYGHGFAYIDYGGLGAPTSTALGYLAQVLNPGRGAAEAAAGFESTGN
ncbi:MAG: hypothetical protein ABSB15_02655 [Bryobacteraceae bacterium]|jgi:hypothetical protein